MPFETVGGFGTFRAEEAEEMGLALAAGDSFGALSEDFGADPPKRLKPRDAAGAGFGAGFGADPPMAALDLSAGFAGAEAAFPAVVEDVTLAGLAAGGFGADPPKRLKPRDATGAGFGAVLKITDVAVALIWLALAWETADDWLAEVLDFKLELLLPVATAFAVALAGEGTEEDGELGFV